MRLVQDADRASRWLDRLNLEGKLARLGIALFDASESPAGGRTGRSIPAIGAEQNEQTKSSKQGFGRPG